MLTGDKVTSIYSIVDDLLKMIGHREPWGRQMSDGEVITTALVSALYFGGHQDNARGFMSLFGFVPHMLSKSRFNRRLHGVSDLLADMFYQFGHALKAIAGASDYRIDSFPVAVCDNMRISRCKLLKGKQWRGKQASMRRYFYGVKVQVLTNEDGIPVEFGFVPGSEADVNALKKLPLAVAAESSIYGDSAYTDYGIEDDLFESDSVYLRIQRKSNSKRKDEPYMAYLKEQMRKGIETTFSGIKAMFLRKIHAVTFKGFLIKIVLFIMEYAFNKSV